MHICWPRVFVLPAVRQRATTVCVRNLFSMVNVRDGSPLPLGIVWMYSDNSRIIFAFKRKSMLNRSHCFIVSTVLSILIDWLATQKHNNTTNRRDFNVLSRARVHIQNIHLITVKNKCQMSIVRSIENRNVPFALFVRFFFSFSFRFVSFHLSNACEHQPKCYLISFRNENITFRSVQTIRVQTIHMN